MKYLLFIFFFVLCGCESSQDMFKSQSSDGGELVDTGIRCQMMARTGSNKKTKVCRTAQQRAKDETDAERSLNKLQKTGMTLGH
ncbi:hypothetical protein [Shewanella woodyi]|uniref:Lipoprotein n=1 Tax=Shewanella woodyi (strain ATCC 51908 / MS32) TaxID=392500 RepID=B1KLQ4_SHEWM|nr:hypothetical protein [Shewanella woodyi]ACA87351.1 hypothetical protein Swoo_3080 [Shewanella woodyi ATCC 51908]